MTKMRKCLVALACALLGVCAVGFASCKKKECKHKWGDYTVTQEATCTSAGEQTKTCSACGKTETETIGAKGHSYGAYQTVTPATCTEDGEERRTCTSCGTTDDRVIRAPGHDYEKKVVPAMCETDGYEIDKCKECGFENQDSYVFLKRLGHEWMVDSNNLTYCTRSCLNGETLYASANLEYSADGTKVLGIGNCYDAKVYIPMVNPASGAVITEVGSAFTGYSTIKRFEITGNVTTIADGACSSCVNLEEIILADSVKTLGGVADGEIAKGVFANCVKVQEVEIPATVETLGAGCFKDCTALTKVTIGESATGIDEEDVVTAVKVISDYVFSGCINLKTIIFGEGVEELGEYAFANCAVENVKFPKSLKTIGGYAFSDCEALKTVVFTDYKTDAALTEVGAYAFSNCSNMEMIEIPVALETVGEGAFSNATSLTEVMIVNVASWSKIDFETMSANPLSNVYEPKDNTAGEQEKQVKLYVEESRIGINFVEIPAEQDGNVVTKIGTYAFAGYKALTNVVIGENVTSIGDGAFADCPNLERVDYNATNATCTGRGTFLRAGSAVEVVGMELVVGANVESLPAYLFNTDYYENTSNLTKVTFDDADGAGNSCLTIGEYAFNHSLNLTEVVMGDAVTTIGERAFYGCKDLATLTISSNASTIGAKAFEGCSSISKAVMPTAAIEYVPQKELKNLTVVNGAIGAQAFDDCDKLETLTIGAGVTDIGAYAFAKCDNLLDVTIEDEAVCAIGDYAFVDCVKMKTLVIGNGVTKVGVNAFMNCAALVTATVGDAVTEIGENAFKNCRSLQTVTLGESLERIGARAFENCSALESVDFRNRFFWTIVGVTEAGEYEWTTALAEKSVAAEYLAKTYIDYEWVCNI